MIFVGMQERTSGLIRGIQVASKMPNSQFIDSRNTSKLHALKNETVIFIRSVDPGLANFLKSRGCTIGYDLLDRPVADHHAKTRTGDHSPISWGTYNLDYIDFYIVNNDLYRSHLASATSKPIYIVPHHNVNAGLIRNDPNRLKTVGYIGLSDQISGLDKIKATCENNGLNFFSSHPNTQQECISDIGKIDVGIIFIDSDGYRDSVLKYKPNTKLTNFQSFGIPTIGAQYQSFLEFGGEEGKSWLKASSIDEVIEKLDFLIKNKDSRIQMSDAAYENGKKFWLNIIINKYYSKLPGFSNDAIGL